MFEAEKMTAKTGNYHKKCFTCATCKRALDYQGRNSIDIWVLGSKLGCKFWEYFTYTGLIKVWAQ